ncbi:MAG: InlB B-repeat-containing protein, partial [Candidatus Micrarchaeia archaeon]
MKGQSALEFLVTYSWAIIIITVFVAIILVLNGFRSPSYYLASSCYIEPLMPCVQTLVTYNAIAPLKFALVFKNNLGTAMLFPQNSLNISISSANAKAASHFVGNCYPNFIPSGAEVLCIATMVGIPKPSVGTQMTIPFTLRYRLCSGPKSQQCSPEVYNTTGTSTQIVAPSYLNLYALNLNSSTPNSYIIINGVAYATNSTTFLIGKQYSVFAMPPAGYVFKSWLLQSKGSSISNTLLQNTTLTLSSNATLIANFVSAVYSTTTSTTISTTTSTTTTSVFTTIPVANVIYEIPIYIYNNQSIPTYSYQQLVLIPPGNDSSLVVYNGSFANFEFFYSNGTIIPAWIENKLNLQSVTSSPPLDTRLGYKQSSFYNRSNPTMVAINNPLNLPGSYNSTNLIIAWLKISKSIPANTVYTIYMGIGNKKINMLSNSGVYGIGEAPELSCPNRPNTTNCSTYAEYDDGSHVFNYYYNFAGNTLPTGWSYAEKNLSRYSVDNGLYLYTANETESNITVFDNIPMRYPQILEAEVFSPFNTFSGIVGMSLDKYANNITGSYLYSYNNRQLFYSGSLLYGLLNEYPSNYTKFPEYENQLMYALNSWYNNGYFEHLSLFNSSYKYAPSLQDISWVNTGFEFGGSNYATVTAVSNSSNLQISNYYPAFWLKSNSSYTLKYQYLRARSLPPDGTMPSISFGKLAGPVKVSGFSSIPSVYQNQMQVLNVNISLGQQPYTYNFTVFNSIGDEVLTASFPRINSTNYQFSYVQNGNWGTGKFTAKVLVTDSKNTSMYAYTTYYVFNIPFIQITLYNRQNTSTPVPFPQMINISIKSYPYAVYNANDANFKYFYA